jgi:hypothetical protein
MMRQKFEYKIAKKILEYDIFNIDKEIEHMNNMKNTNSVQKEEIIKYCNERLTILNRMKNKKLESLKTLNEKYEKRV